MGQFYGSWGQKKEICVFPVSQPFASGIRNVRNPNFFWIDLPDLDGNQAILLKKRFEKLFRSSSARNHRVKFCLVNENADNTVQYFKYRRVPTKLTSSCKKCFKKKKVDLSFLQDEIGNTHFYFGLMSQRKKNTIHDIHIPCHITRAGNNLWIIQKSTAREVSSVARQLPTDFYITLPSF